MDRIIPYALGTLLFVVTVFGPGNGLGTMLFVGSVLLMLLYSVYVWGIGFALNMAFIFFALLILILAVSIRRELIFKFLLLVTVLIPLTFFLGFKSLAIDLTGVFFFVTIAGSLKDLGYGKR